MSRLQLRSLATAALTPLLFALATPATAQGTGEWRVTIAPYIWATGLNGDVGVFEDAPPTEVDLEFSDILENLRFAGMVAASVDNGVWGIASDLQYITLATDGDTQGDAFDGYDFEQNVTIFSLMGEYRIGGSEDTNIWLSGGARYWSVTTDLEFDAGTQPSATFDGDDTWWDPIIGFRGQAELGRDTFFTGWAYTGGFGSGSDSMADLFAGIGYEFTSTTAGIIGYRYMQVNRDTDDFLWDVEQQGLMVGLRFQL